MKSSLPKSPKTGSAVFHHLVIATVPFWRTHCPHVFCEKPSVLFRDGGDNRPQTVADAWPRQMWRTADKKKKFHKVTGDCCFRRRRSDISSFGCSYLIRRRDRRSDWLPLPLTYGAGKSCKFHVAARFWSVLPYLIFGIVLWWQRSHIFGEGEPGVGFPSGLDRN